MPTNRHGLIRNIPINIKRNVRRNSKFGCVICRQLICEYEHIDPPFAEALAHEANNICLLCPTHHAEVTRGLLSKDQIKEAYSRTRTDERVKPPFYEMQLTGRNLVLAIGDSLFEYVPDQSAIISVDGEVLLHVAYQTDPMSGVVFPSISARLYDRDGDRLLEIDDNELQFSKTAHDIETQGRVIRIYTAERKYGIELTIAPPSRIELQRLHMWVNGIELMFDGNFAVRIPHSSDSVVEIGMPGIEAHGATAAVHYSSAPEDRHMSDQLIVGGVGVRIPGTGLTFARQAGAMWIKRFYVRRVKPIVRE